MLDRVLYVWGQSFVACACASCSTELTSMHACFDSHANRLRIMTPPRAQCVATKTVSLFTLLLLFSPSSAQEPGELMNGL